MRLGVAAVLTLFCSTATAATERHVIAVFGINFSDAPGFAQDDSPKFTALLDSVVAASGYKTIPQTDIRARLTAQKAVSFDPCYDDACQIDIGKELAAQKALSSSWARFDRTCTLTVKLYDLRTSVTEFSTKADGSCDAAGLRSAIEQVGTVLRARRDDGHGSFTIDLEEGRAIKNPPTDKVGYLKIKAEAKGRPSEKIEVYVNGELVGSVVNTFFAKELAIGRYSILLRTAGDRYAHARFDIEMTTAGKEIPGTGLVQLMPTFGTLILDGTPSEATVVLDGEPRSIRGSHSEERRVGTHTVLIEAAGYLPAPPRSVTIAPGETVRIQYALIRNAGTISVQGSPSGAEFMIDGRLAGAIPMEIPDIDVGDHIVEVRAPGYRPSKQVVSVQRGKRADIQFQLEQKLARLKIEAVANVEGTEVPVEADVIIDGKRVGGTPWKGDVPAELPHRIELQLGKRKTPVRATNLAEGTETREIVAVPSSWGGAVSSVQFEGGDQAMEIRSGPAQFSLDRPNFVRAGRLTLEFVVAGSDVGGGALLVAPDEKRIVTIVERPRTSEELDRSRVFWTWRKWISIGATAVAGSFAVQQVIVAHNAASDRDEAFAALRVASVADDVDFYRSFVVDRDAARASSQNIALGLLAASVFFGGWSAYEWIFGEPQAGRLIVEGLDEVTR